MPTFLAAVVTLGLAVLLLSQCRRPMGPVGWFYAWYMNHSHSDLTDWALKQIAVGRSDEILDVGCGGGRTVAKLAALAPEGMVCGVDFSGASATVARRTNAAAIAAGRVRIEVASVASLPFPDRAFDVVTAFETHYYWPDLPANAREILRVVKPGGTVALVAEVHRTGKFDGPERLAMGMLRGVCLTAAEHRALLAQAGLENVTTVLGPKRGWICVTGRRPVDPATA